MRSHKLAILKNETDDAHLMWVKACEKMHVKFDMIDLPLNNWMEELQKTSYDYYLACPSGTVSYFKTMYDERIYIIDKVLGFSVYPSFDEIALHENKRMLSYWLTSQNISHPKTKVFYKKNDAFDFINKTPFPVTAKTNIGASGKGVEILKSKKAAVQYINKAFSGTGIKQSTGPNLKMGDIKKRLIYALINPYHIFKRLKVYKAVSGDVQKHFIIFQEYISHDFEWRVVKIGNSYFGYKKMKKGDKCSGRKGYIYDPPPFRLLDFVKQICDKYNFNSMAIDIFEDDKGGYLINEMQTMFGHVQDHICEKNGVPGRFIYTNDNWQFEPGMFNANLSYDLRLENVLRILENNKV